MVCNLRYRFVQAIPYVKDLLHCTETRQNAPLYSSVAATKAMAAKATVAESGTTNTAASADMAAMERLQVIYYGVLSTGWVRLNMWYKDPNSPFNNSFSNTFFFISIWNNKKERFYIECWPYIRPFNLHPDKWFGGYPVKSTQIFIGCHLRFFRVASTQIFFRVAAWKKLSVVLINQK